jgi:hypothetical protein
MMIIHYQKLYVAVLLFLISSAAKAQTSPADLAAQPEQKTGSVKFGISYLSNNVFMGRSDTTRTPTILPNVKYSFANGIYVSGSLYYISNRKKNKVDGGDLSAGYDFDITDDLTGSVSYTKLFYNSNSTVVGSAISSTFNGTLSYDIGNIVTPTVGFDFNLNKQNFGNDLFFNFGLAHDFSSEGIFGQKDVFIISPTAALNIGTQNFFDAYLTKKKYRNATKTAAENKLIASESAYLNEFKLLDYEFSVPLEYKTGNVMLTFIPTYSFAKNKLPASIASKLSTESGIFYFQTGVALKF